MAAPGNSLIVADYGQDYCTSFKLSSMLDAFNAGVDFHSNTTMDLYPHIRDAVEQKRVLLEWHPQPGEDKPPVPLVKDLFASEWKKSKMLNVAIPYGISISRLARELKVSVMEAKRAVARWYSEREDVRHWQHNCEKEVSVNNRVHTLLGRTCLFPPIHNPTRAQKAHIARAAISTTVQGSAADVAMCAMLEISKNARLKELGWRLLLQVYGEVILEGPTESAAVAKAIVLDCMSKPFDGENILRVGLSVDAECAENWYSAKCLLRRHTASSIVHSELS